ncbi:hypothetical protein C8R43DRAFT_942605 [Mycena crocata]|nr:hypothetical protein C8R43DRAFT_942605 [Mycena crocata]
MGRRARRSLLRYLCSQETIQLESTFVEKREDGYVGRRAGRPTSPEQTVVANLWQTPAYSPPPIIRLDLVSSSRGAPRSFVWLEPVRPLSLVYLCHFPWLPWLESGVELALTIHNRDTIGLRTRCDIEERAGYVKLQAFGEAFVLKPDAIHIFLVYTRNPDAARTSAVYNHPEFRKRKRQLLRHSPAHPHPPPSSPIACAARPAPLCLIPHPTPNSTQTLSSGGSQPRALEDEDAAAVLREREKERQQIRDVKRGAHSAAELLTLHEFGLGTTTEYDFAEEPGSPPSAYSGGTARPRPRTRPERHFSASTPPSSSSSNSHSHSGHGYAATLQLQRTAPWLASATTAAALRPPEPLRDSAANKSSPSNNSKSRSSSGGDKEREKAGSENLAPSAIGVAGASVSNANLWSSSVLTSSSHIAVHGHGVHHSPATSDASTSSVDSGSGSGGYRQNSYARNLSSHASSHITGLLPPFSFRRSPFPLHLRLRAASMSGINIHGTVAHHYSRRWRGITFAGRVRANRAVRISGSRRNFLRGFGLRLTPPGRVAGTPGKHLQLVASALSRNWVVGSAASGGPRVDDTELTGRQPMTGGLSPSVKTSTEYAHTVTCMRFRCGWHFGVAGRRRVRRGFIR